MRGDNLRGGLQGQRLRGDAHARSLAHARAWHVKMKPVFDALDARGAFSDSPPPLSPFAKREC